MTIDLILAAISAAGAWAYAVVAVAVWRAIGERTTDGPMVAAIASMWVLGLGIGAVLLALTLTLRWLPKTQGILAVTWLGTSFGAGFGTGVVLEEGGERGICAALWPVASLCWLVARVALVVARVTARFATIATAPARLVGRKRIGTQEREARIAALEKDLGVGS